MPPAGEAKRFMKSLFLLAPTGVFFVSSDIAARRLVTLDVLKRTRNRRHVHINAKFTNDEAVFCAEPSFLAKHYLVNNMLRNLADGCCIPSTVPTR